MSQQDALVAARVRARRRSTGIAMGFGLLLCLAGALWAFNTLGEVGDRAAVELVPETTLPSIPDPAATPVDGTTPPPAEGTTAPPEPAVPITRFVSPSGNIACIISEQFARCDVAEKSWDAGPPPAACTSTYGQGVVVSVDGPAVVCAKDSLVGAGGGTLAYGRDVTVGDYTCASSEAGMRCAQASTGFGFSVSRRAYTFF